MKLHITQLREELSTEINDMLTDHDIVRFLIARKCNLEKATLMVNNWYQWFISPIEGSVNPEFTPMNIIDGTDVDEPIYTKYMPHSNLGYALNGSPIYWEKTGLISSRFKEIREEISGDVLTVRHIR